MCSPSAMIGAGAGVSVLGNYYSQKAQAENAQAQMNAQAKASIKNMSFAFQDYEIEREDAFDSAVVDMTKIKQNSMQLNSQVKNTVLENMSGKNAQALIRSAEGDTAEAVASVKDNYSRKSNEIDLNKERVLEQTKSQINAINASAPKMPSRFSNLLSTAGAGLNAYTQAQSISNAKRFDTFQTGTGGSGLNFTNLSGGIDLYRMGLTQQDWSGLHIKG